MTFKLHEAAITVNKYVSQKGLEIPDDMLEWKYYLNASGIYHSIDNLIKIRSLDKQVQSVDDDGDLVFDSNGKAIYEPEIITFSKDNWVLHPYTKEQYSYDTRRYRDLVQQFPNKEPFIISSLFPADLQYAVDCPNGSILAYDKSLVEENEYTLIKEVQEFAYNFTRRWYNPGYALLHDMYLGTFYVLLHNAVYMKIVSARTARIHTDQVHSFHVNNHLSSFHWLGQYIPNLSAKQLHWLYRNIRFITKNVGQKQTFEWLVENLFKDSKIPLYEYVMKHVIDEDVDYTNFDGFRPTPIMIRRPLSVGDGTISSDVSANELLNKTKKLAKENEDYKEQYSIEVSNVLSDSTADTLATKTLECEVNNMAQANLFTLPGITFTHWLAYSALKQYTYSVEFTAPKNATSATITSMDAAMLYMYSLYKVYYPDRNFKFNSITLNHIYLPYMSDISRLQARIPERTLPQSSVTELYGFMPDYEVISNKYDFIEYCKSLKDNLYKQWLWYNAHYKPYTDAALNTAMNLRNRTIHIDTSGYTFEQLLEKNFVDTRDYTIDDYQQLADDLQKSFIGDPEESAQALRDSQRSITNIVLKLSSYSIQIADNSNAPDMVYIPAELNKVLLIQHGGTHYATDYKALCDAPDVWSKHTYDYKITDRRFEVSISEKEPKSRLIDNDKYSICLAGKNKVLRAYTALDGNSHFNTTENYGLAFYALTPEQRVSDLELLN